MSYRAWDSSTDEIHHVPGITQLNTTIANLKPYTRYYVQVAAQTTPGCGATAKVDTITQEDGKNFGQLGNLLIQGRFPNDVCI